MESNPSPIVLDANGPLDVTAARRLTELVAAHPDAAIVIDLSRAAPCDPYALTVVTDAAAARKDVSIRGLRDRERLVLAYLGVRF
jgi:hypothetical protein